MAKSLVCIYPGCELDAAEGSLYCRVRHRREKSGSGGHKKASRKSARKKSVKKARRRR